MFLVDFFEKPDVEYFIQLYVTLPMSCVSVIVQASRIVKLGHVITILYSQKFTEAEDVCQRPT